jgi:hypothetical protein
VSAERRDPDALEPEASDTEVPSRRRWPTWALAGLLVVAVATVAVPLTRSWLHAQEVSARFCEGVGLVGTPVEPTPDAAFRAWLAGEATPSDAHPNPSAWTKLPRSQDGANGAPDNAVVWEERAHPHHTVAIWPSTSGWLAQGACVG